MTDDLMRYDLMVEQALRTVVREVIGRIAQDGLPGEHHLYITFRTGEQGVSLPDFLTERYPDEMTIVLQHQFEDLVVDHDGFAVTLNFNQVKERMHIPFASISAFADPTSNFGLQFKFEDAEETVSSQFIPPEMEFQTGAGKDDESEQKTAKNDETGSNGNVVTLDTFRKN